MVILFLKLKADSIAVFLPVRSISDKSEQAIQKIQSLLLSDGWDLIALRGTITQPEKANAAYLR